MQQKTRERKLSLLRMSRNTRTLNAGVSLASRIDLLELSGCGTPYAYYRTTPREYFSSPTLLDFHPNIIGYPS